MERTCGNCALKTLKGGKCPIFNADMSDEQGCPYFTIELKTCDICGNLIIKGGTLEIDNDVPHLLCQECATGPQCQICTNNQECRFQTDRSCPEPQMTTVQQHRGNMIVQTQAINPKRVEATCAKGCSCYWADGAEDGEFCLKQIGCGCKNYKTNWRK